MSSAHTDEQVSEWRENIAFGVFLVLLAGLILYLSQSIRVNDFGNSDPGPKAIPIACAVIMLLGGIYEFVAVCFASRVREDAAFAERKATMGDANGSRRGVITLVGLVVYLVAMNWLGFNLSTLIFATLALLALGSRWWIALLSSGCIVVLVHLLFVKLFQVSLPLSVWGNF